MTQAMPKDQKLYSVQKLISTSVARTIDPSYSIFFTEDRYTPRFVAYGDFSDIELFNLGLVVVRGRRKGSGVKVADENIVKCRNGAMPLDKCIEYVYPLWSKPYIVIKADASRS